MVQTLCARGPYQNRDAVTLRTKAFRMLEWRPATASRRLKKASGARAGPQLYCTSPDCWAAVRFMHCHHRESRRRAGSLRWACTLSHTPAAPAPHTTLVLTPGSCCCLCGAVPSSVEGAMSQVCRWRLPAFFTTRSPPPPPVHTHTHGQAVLTAVRLWARVVIPNLWCGGRWVVSALCSHHVRALHLREQR